MGGVPANSRRPLWRVLLAACLAATSVVPVVSLVSGPAAASLEQPNVLVVLTDDQTVEELAGMPFLTSQPDGHWIEFSNAFVTTPLCCPSRATILTGQHSWSHGVTQNNNGHLLDESQTLATWLDAAGYRTGLIGKYLNTYPFDRGDSYVPPGWDDWTAFLGTEIGYTDYSLNQNGTVVTYGAADSDYSTDVLRDRALQFLDEPAGDPFFLLFSPYGPHAPSTPPERHKSTYADAVLPRSPNVDESDVSDKPAWVQALPLMTEREEAVRDKLMRRSLGAVRAVDEAIEAMFASLRDSGRLDDTVVVFLSDNGTSYWSHRHAGKQCAYEECAKVPLLIRYPGAVERVEPALVGNVDLASTVAELAGAVPTIPQDGTSLLPLIDGTAPQWREHFPLGLVDSGVTPDYWALRTATHKYVELVTGEVELYDLVADPYELDNVAGDPEYAAVQAALAFELDRTNSIDVTLSRSRIPADGESSVAVEVSVADAAGKGAAGEPVAVTTSGDVTVGPLVDRGSGRYTATLTASTTPGDEVITATLGPLEASVLLEELESIVVGSVDPASLEQGAQTTQVSVLGDGFGPGISVSFGEGVKVKSVRLVSPEQLNVRVSVTRRAPIGPRDVTVSSGPLSGTCSACFQVTAPP